jgi:type IV pilus assembly protein PilB
MSQLPALIHRERPRTAPDDSAPIVRIQKIIFEEAARLDASDIHIEPAQFSTRVRYRVNGVLKEGLEIPKWMHENLVVRIKVLAKLDITERKVPQDGHITAEDANSQDIRVSIIPTRCGEKIVIRVLRRGRALMSLSAIGFQADVEQRLQALIRRPQGILLSVGPTGSGKTTTLYALVSEIRDEPLNIVTIEDPIEYEVDRLSQVPVNEKAGLTFAKALRSILRQDPDVILLGEIRDADTARTALHAALTGHLVLSTLHATDAISALVRLSELGIDRSVLATAVIGIVAQRLVRLNCPGCAVAERPRPIYLQRLHIEPGFESSLRQSSGCPHCNSTGSTGRVGLFELLEVNGKVRNAMLAASEPELRKAARGEGFVGITEQAIEMALSGRVALGEVYRTCYFGGE